MTSGSSTHQGVPVEGVVGRRSRGRGEGGCGLHGPARHAAAAWNDVNIDNAIIIIASCRLTIPPTPTYALLSTTQEHAQKSRRPARAGKQHNSTVAQLLRRHVSYTPSIE